MKSNINQYIETWMDRCYFKDIPDESPDEIIDKVPSYKRIAIAILKNDYPLKSLGFTPKKSKYYSMLKKIEIEERNAKNKI
jgi:predicted phosphoadenosine phosphosulfate sulfurtransferase